ncbi:MAG TPA: PHP domain-containing protein [bacterium]|nr:PHP domain-containing protein [bacterium]
MSFLDCHNHTAEWSDGRQSIEQVMEKARLEGVRVGLSDHAGLGEYLNSNDRLLAYADFLSQYPVARGLEMDLGRGFQVSPQARPRFDYMIGSVHGLEVAGARFSFAPLIQFTKGEKPDYDPRKLLPDMDLLFRAHLDLLAREYGSQKFDILGHCTMLPPLALAPLGQPEEAFPEWWEDELVALLLKHGVAMEISNRWKTPYGRLMEKGVKAGLTFSLGSDGHDPAKTCVLDYPKEMIRKFNLPENRLFDIARKLEAA